MPQLLAPGTTARDSADFTVATSANLSMWIIGSTNEAPIDPATVVKLKIKDTVSGFYRVAGELTPQVPAQVLTGPGTFKVSINATTLAMGVATD